MESRGNSGSVGMRQTTVVELRLRENHSGERGLAEPGREGAHRRVSRAADSEAELTVALDGARTRRWPQNRRRSAAGGGGALCTRGQSERERASKSGRGRKWARGGGQAGCGAQKGGGGSDVARERADVGASTAGDCEREVRDD
jgi:hypothetical protein